jgi:L-ornithine N5-oxygenase
MVTMAELAGARLDGDEVVLTLLDRKSGEPSELRCDVVLLGTGFSKRMPAIVRDLGASIGLDEVTVNRSYRMDLPPAFTGTCHLQGVNEATHGIADSLLSVLAVRAEEIVNDLLAHRRAAPKAVTLTAQVTESAVAESPVAAPQVAGIAAEITVPAAG